MGNRKGRELRLKQAQEALWLQVNTEPRPLDQDVHLHGIGLLRAKLLLEESFQPPKIWDIRQSPIDNQLILYKSEVIEADGYYLAIGYNQIIFPSTQLQLFFDQIVNVVLPVGFEPIMIAGIDGTSFQIEIFYGLNSSIRFKWWSNVHDQWKPLTEPAEQLFRILSDFKSPIN